MSKKIEAAIGCPSCGNEFDVELYRTIWIEEPRNRELIFSDKINRFDCPTCKYHINTEFAFLCTNVRRKIAVWYEPEPDPQVEKDVAMYRAHMGRNSFYAQAPRVRDWEEFKAKIVELEANPAGGGAAPTLSPSMMGAMAGFVRSLRGKK